MRLIVIALAAAGALAAGAAKAQLFWQPGEPAAVPYPPGVAGGGGWSASASRPPKPACEKMCQNDFSPCDPIYFKTEDGRCAGINLR